MEALELVKYRGSRRMLETLLKFPDRQFTISELAREAGVPFASAWRLVKKWGPAGIVDTGRVGKSVTVKLRGSGYVKRVASILDASVSPQAFAASALCRVLSRDARVKQAFLFGSVAGGSERLESDVDVALLAEKGFDANKLLFDAFEKHGAKLVPIVFSSKNEFDAFMTGKNARRLK